jgi:hypothetical protein
MSRSDSIEIIDHLVRRDCRRDWPVHRDCHPDWLVHKGCHHGLPGRTDSHLD